MLNTLNKCYKFRIYPSTKQTEILMQMNGARRFVWNWALEKCEKYYTENNKTIKFKTISSDLTILKKTHEYKWLNECNAKSLQQSLNDLISTYNGFFNKKNKLPKFKSKKTDHIRFRVPQDVQIKGNMIKFPRMSWIRIRGVKEIKGNVKSATFSMDALNKWHVSILVEFENKIKASPIDGNIIGIDLGLKDFVVTSDGDRVESCKFYRKAENKLKHSQRELCRKKAGSARMNKARRKVASIHIKIKNKRNDFIHKLTSSLVRKYNVICIEDLNVKGLARTKLAKSIHDASFGEFRRQLEYKSLWNGKHLVCIDRFYPSSKKCSICGNINKELKLSDREWTCLECNTKHDRDLNAAINIKNEGARMLGVDLGIRDTVNACGGTVRLLEIVAGPCESST